MELWISKAAQITSLHGTRVGFNSGVGVELKVNSNSGVGVGVGVELFWVGVGVELNFCCEAGVGIGVGVELFWVGVGIGVELFWVTMKKMIWMKKITEILQIYYFLIIKMHNFKQIRINIF